MTLAQMLFQDFSDRVESLRTMKKQQKEITAELEVTTERIRLMSALLRTYGYNLDQFREELRSIETV